MPSESAALPAGWLQPQWQQPQALALMSSRAGGHSSGPFAAMNVGDAVGDDVAAVAANRRLLAELLDSEPVFLRQVHGAQVLRLAPAHLGQSPEADAAISDDPGLAVAIQVADCLPVLFAAPGVVGGAHAGWRGLAGGVLENTVAALCEAAGCAPQQIAAWLGVCIGPQAFEVGGEVREAFGAAAAADGTLFRYRPNAAGEPRWRADLAGLAQQRLRAAGLQQISQAQGCSFSEPSRFFSFRRDRVCGRMVAAIRLRG